MKLTKKMIADFNEQLTYFGQCYLAFAKEATIGKELTLKHEDIVKSMNGFKGFLNFATANQGAFMETKKNFIHIKENNEKMAELKKGAKEEHKKAKDAAPTEATTETTPSTMKVEK